MARVHTLLPSHRGELELAKQLSVLEDDHLHLWFGVNFIPTVPDIDIVIWHEDAGVFAVEVKAVPLDGIECFGWDYCKIAGRPADRGPADQALTAVHALRNFLGKSPEMPFVNSVACWPRIRRRHWNEGLADDRICGAYAESMLFMDDLYSDPMALRDRLEYIRLHTESGDRRQSGFAHDVQTFRSFRDALNTRSRPKPPASDRERLRVLENEVTARTRKDVPAHGQQRILYSGRPSTGKTFRLLEVALNHARHGCKVLFVCYNRVLATDIRRLLGFSDHLRSSDGSIDVHATGELFTNFARQQDCELEEDSSYEDYEEWSQLVLEEMRARPEALPKYDTVLVDEGQDIPQRAFEMIDLHVKPSSTICVAAGDGQQLYGEEAPWLEEFRGRSEPKQLRRVFRNPATIFQLATLCYEAKLDSGKIEASFRRFRNRSNSSGQLTFERDAGDLPRLESIDDSAVGLDSGQPGRDLHELMVREYARIIKRELEELGPDEKPIDLLLLVPSNKSKHHHHPWVVEALRRERLDYVDYAERGQRSVVPDPGAIRLCTYHSSRGAEGHRVVVFGLEQLRSLADSVEAAAHRLGYIVLSRAVMQLVIPYQISARSPVIQFVQDAIAQIRREMAPPGDPRTPGKPKHFVGKV